MKIRAITGFIDPKWPLQKGSLKLLSACMLACKESLVSIGYDVQTLRLATPSPCRQEKPIPASDLVAYARALEAEAFVHGLDYVSIGPACPEEMSGYHIIPKLLEATETVFSSGIIAESDTGVHLEAARACGHIIADNAILSPDGFMNLRFAALANVHPGTPFFPASYHDGGTPSIAIATEAADVALNVIFQSRSLSDTRKFFIQEIERHTAAIELVLTRITAEHSIQFTGIDFSLAPYPAGGRSFGGALQALGIPAAGLSGSAAASAFLASCIDDAHFQRTGFSGLFFPILEDSVLAARNSQGLISISDLLLYSTLCGTGLDTIPLPGDTSPEALTAVLIDVGAIALRHNKPLTARLMPIPDKQAGDPIEFDFEYFAPSHVMRLDSQPLSGMMAGTDPLPVAPRA